MHFSYVHISVEWWTTHFPWLKEVYRGKFKINYIHLTKIYLECVITIIPQPVI